MRIWSFSPEYLDVKGLLAVWREGLLALAVLQNKTKGYKNHPQLRRFKDSSEGLQFLKLYLYEVYLEAEKRNYSFNPSKIIDIKAYKADEKIPLNSGQLEYEWKHYLEKIRNRAPGYYEKYKGLPKPAPAAVFYEVEGGIENWEKIKNGV
jgi:hypothetical protein